MVEVSRLGFTLMPGRMPSDFIMSTNGVPSSAFWYSVSSKRITPDTYSSMPRIEVLGKLRCFRLQVE